MSDISNLIHSLLEADEEEDFPVKELVEPEPLRGGKTDVKRYGRFKVVDTERFTFLISFLTPVAVYDKVFRTYYQTTKQWSPTTNQHIRDWADMIWKSPEWQNDPANRRPSDYPGGTGYVASTHFKGISQQKLSKLFRDLMSTMELKPHLKRRMYHVDPRMRKGSEWQAKASQWTSGHLKQHDTGKEGLPDPGEHGFEDFFADFEPSEANYWEWSNTGLKNLEPHETKRPDEFEHH